MVDFAMHTVASACSWESHAICLPWRCRASVRSGVRHVVVAHQFTFTFTFTPASRPASNPEMHVPVRSAFLSLPVVSDFLARHGNA